MSDYATLYPLVADVLLSDTAAKIDFWAFGMHVSGAGYRAVWYAITKGWIKLLLAKKGIPSTYLPPGVAALYENEIHTLHFSLFEETEDAKLKMYILHECTHALRDIMASSAFATEGAYGSNISGQSYYDNEAVGYIAGMLFYFYLTNQDDMPMTEGSPDGDIYAAAIPIARAIKGKPGAHVDQKAFLDLRSVIIMDPAYAKEHPPNQPDQARGID